MRKLLSVDDCHIIHSPGSMSAGERSASDSELGYQSWGADEDYGGNLREEIRILLFPILLSQACYKWKLDSLTVFQAVGVCNENWIKFSCIKKTV